MELIISFLIGLGVITSGDGLTTNDVQDLQTKYNDQLVQKYGDQYIDIIVTDDTEKQ